jgi:adenosylcobinamide-phosphate synthase
MAFSPLPLLSPLAAIAAVGLDRVLGEPRRGHPLELFGRLAERIETALRADIADDSSELRWRGALAWALAVLPLAALAWWMGSQPGWGLAANVLLLYFALGARSLAQHAAAVERPLAAGDLPLAREEVGRIVSRDTSALDGDGVARAGVESVLENGNDAIFGALFWFMIGGGGGAVLYRLANTLDAMWGYRTPRYRHFGWAAARLDDLLNYVPSRLTAASYALLGRTSAALRCWRAQAGAWESPNAGPVMAAGAGALSVRLGGSAVYHGSTETRPDLGCGADPVPADIGRAVDLVRRTLWLWLALWLNVGFVRGGW